MESIVKRIVNLLSEANEEYVKGFTDALIWMEERVYVGNNANVEKALEEVFNGNNSVGEW